MEVQNPFQIRWAPLTTETTTWQFMKENFQKYDRALALVDTQCQRQWTYGEMIAEVQSVAKRLSAHILDNQSSVHGTRIALCMNSSARCIMLQLACASLRCPCVMLNPTASTDELWHHCDLCEAQFVICESDMLTKLEDVKKRASLRGCCHLNGLATVDHIMPLPGNGMPRDVVVDDASEGDSEEQKSVASSVRGGRATGTNTPSRGGAVANVRKTLSVSQLSPKPGSIRGPDKATDATPTALMFFSNGSTGLPKPIEISHASIIVNLQQISCPQFSPPSTRDKILNHLFHHHIFGTLIAYYGLYNGACVCISRYDRQEIIKHISTYKITHLCMVPPMICNFLHDIECNSRVVSSVRYIISTSAPLDKTISLKCIEKLKCTIKQIYVATKCGGIVTWSPINNDNKLTSVGTPLPGVICRIVNEQKAIRAPNERGELLIKGPQITARVYKNTKNTMEMYDNEGYMRTGDLAYYDTDGYVHVVGRLKDVIKYKNEKVMPSEIEAAVRTHPAVADCAIVARPDTNCGEAPCVFIVKTAAGADATAQDIRQHVQASTQAAFSFRQNEKENPSPPATPTVQSKALPPKGAAAASETRPPVRASKTRAASITAQRSTRLRYLS